MDLREALYNELAATTALTALVADRIYPGESAREAAYPYIVLTQIDDTRSHALNIDSPVRDVFYQVSTFAENYDDAKQVAAQVDAALTDFKGLLGGGGGITVERIFFEGEQEFKEPESKTWHIPQDYRIIHD